MTRWDQRPEMLDALTACAVAVDLALAALRRQDESRFDVAVELLLEASAAIEEGRR